MFKVLVYGYQCGIYSSRKLEDRKAPDHSMFSRFRTGRCKDVVEGLFYQYVCKLEQDGELDHGAVFIDGTKLETQAGRYTFCWRRSVEKHLAKVKGAGSNRSNQCAGAAPISGETGKAAELCTR